MKKFLYPFLFVLLILLFNNKIIFAAPTDGTDPNQPPTANTTSTPNSSGTTGTTGTQDPNTATGETGSTTDNAEYTLIPTLEGIDDATPTVKITLNNLTGGEIFVCMESDMCIDNDKIREGISNGDADMLAKAQRGMSVDDVDEGTIQRYRLVNGEIVVCGDGPTDLKPDGTDQNHRFYKGQHGGDEGDWWIKMKKDGKAGCNEKRDYFHPGKVYVFTTYRKGGVDDKGKDLWVLGTIGGFYVNHHAPVIDVQPTTNISPNTSFSISLSTDADKAPGKNQDDWAWSIRNNYQVLIEGSGWLERRCGTVYKDGSKLFSLTPPQDKAGQSVLQPGPIKITISEQVNEFAPIVGQKGSLAGALQNAKGNVSGKKILDFTDELIKPNLQKWYLPPFTVDSAAAVCQGGFVYRVYNCHVGGNSPKFKANSCENYKDPATNVSWPYIQDPNKEDIRGFMKYLDTLGANAATSSLPCNVGGVMQKNPGACKSIDTAIGKIPVDPVGFITKLFSLILSIAGLGAMLIIFYSGYRLLLSRGNKEVIQAARDRITSAIVGLIFIILSLVLLSLITGSILKIPGFQ